MSYIFRIYMFGIVDVDNFLYKFGQNWQSLTLKKNYRHYIVEWREYIKNQNIFAAILFLLFCFAIYISTTTRFNPCK